MSATRGNGAVTLDGGGNTCSSGGGVDSLFGVGGAGTLFGDGTIYGPDGTPAGDLHRSGRTAGRSRNQRQVGRG